MRKPTIKINSKEVSKLMSFCVSKYILYGEPWVIWWGKIGAKEFVEWAGKKGLKYIDENPKQENTQKQVG